MAGRHHPARGRCPGSTEPPEILVVGGATPRSRRPATFTPCPRVTDPRGLRTSCGRVPTAAERIGSFSPAALPSECTGWSACTPEHIGRRGVAVGLVVDERADVLAAGDHLQLSVGAPGDRPGVGGTGGVSAVPSTAAPSGGRHADHSHEGELPPIPGPCARTARKAFQKSGLPNAWSGIRHREWSPQAGNCRNTTFSSHDSWAGKPRARAPAPGPNSVEAVFHLVQALRDQGPSARRSRSSRGPNAPIASARARSALSSGPAPTALAERVGHVTPRARSRVLPGRGRPCSRDSLHQRLRQRPRPGDQPAQLGVVDPEHLGLGGEPRDAGRPAAPRARPSSEGFEEAGPSRGLPHVRAAGGRPSPSSGGGRSDAPRRQELGPERRQRRSAARALALAPGRRAGRASPRWRRTFHTQGSAPGPGWRRGGSPRRARVLISLRAGAPRGVRGPAGARR